MTRNGILFSLMVGLVLSVNRGGGLYGKEETPCSLKIPAIFGDNMVLQQGIQAPVWGTANSGERVSVHFAGQEKTAVADGGGNWMVRLDPVMASLKPDVLAVVGQTGQLVFTNVLVGEVWLCSGQSNMECGFAYLKISDEVKDVSNPQIRLTAGGGWSLCTTENLLPFSCVGYYFGLNVWKQLHVPVGLINISRGCSSIEAWMTPESLEANGALVDKNGCNLFAEMKRFQQFCSLYERCDASEKERVFLEHCQSKYGYAHGFVGEDGKLKPGTYSDILGHMMTVKPAYQYTTRIAPIVPFGIKGVIWYQGETNVGESLYALKQRILVESWRSLWKVGDFPFYFVQVAPFKWYPELPDFWLEQYEAARTIPNSGLVSTVDITSLEECHPLNKRDVGLRLALLALRDTYGRKDVVASGPTYRSMTMDGAQILISFNHADSGLTTKDGQPPDWFEVAGADGKFVKATASLQGVKVAVLSPVENPAAVRYAWDGSAVPNLRNREGLPAFPFNTAKPFFHAPGK